MGVGTWKDNRLVAPCHSERQRRISHVGYRDSSLALRMTLARTKDGMRVISILTAFSSSLAVFLDEYVAVIAHIPYMYFYSLWRIIFMIENTAHIALKMSDTFKHNH